jgi:hypothetical protein
MMFVINRLPILSRSNSSPFQSLFHQIPDYQFLRTIGCECFPLLHPYTSHKLQARSESCIFMGYSSLHKGYYCLHLPTNKIYVSHHVIFNESVYPFATFSESTQTISTSPN